jgi:hypothetical protein
MIILSALICLNCFGSIVELTARYQPPSDAVRQEKIRAIRTQIRNLRAKDDVAGLRQFVPEAKTKWLSEGQGDYLPAVLDLCVALNSITSGQTEVIDIARDLAASAIDLPGEKPPELVCKFAAILQGDPDYSRGQLAGDAWRKERRVRVVRWLTVWQSLHQHVAALPAPTGPVYPRIDPPPEAGFPSGFPVSPKEIKDPVIRKKYEDQIAKNNEGIKLLQKKKDAQELEKTLAVTAKQYLIDAYSKPPYDTIELERLLSTSVVDAATRSAILDEVKRRAAARPDSPVPPKNPVPTKTPEPGPITWRNDPRLRVPVTLDLRAPTVDDVLRELQKATGVPLSRADDIQHAAPALGSLSTRGVSARQVMENLAKSKRVEGTWESDGPGYRLVSNGNAVQLSDPSAEPAAPDEPGRRNFLLALLGGNLLILLVVAGAYWWRRTRQAAPPPPSSSTPTPTPAPTPEPPGNDPGPGQP